MYKQPTVHDFAAMYSNYGPLAKGDGKFLFDLLTSEDWFVKAKVATLDLDLPAVAGLAKVCVNAINAQNVLPLDNNTKRYVGAVVACVMVSNGFQKTGEKRAIPHKAFSKGEFYRLPSQP